MKGSLNKVKNKDLVHYTMHRDKDLQDALKMAK